MFFNDLIQRRLAALLQPWLRDDPELEFKLGFLRSNGTLNNVSFNTSALNELLEDPSRCCFKEVSIEHLNIKISPWSSSAFILAIRGLRFVLSLGEEEDERGVKWRPRVKDITMEDKNKVLTEIDPEGCTLHASLRRIADITTRTWRKSILNTLFAHSQIQFHDVHVLFQSPNSHNAFSCSLYVKKIEAGSQTFGHRCFVSGLMGSFVVPSEECSFDVDIDHFEIRLNSKNSHSSVIPATNMSALVNVTNLQFTSICLRVPRLKILFSPADLSVMLLFYALLSKESKCVRPGRLLWKIVASRISSLLPFTNQSMHKVVKFACLWLRYVNTYHNLLLLVGYPASDLMKRSAEVMYRDTTYSRSVKSNWNLISKIEIDLPLEAIAIARQKTRFRLALRGPGKTNSFDELLGKGPIWKLPKLLMLILRFVGSLFHFIARSLLLHKVLAIFRKSRHNYGIFQEEFRLGTGISLIVQQISISVSPNDSVKRSAYRKAVTVSAVSYQDLLSLHILADAFFLRYTVNVSEQYFMSSFGCLKILSSPLMKTGASKSKEPADKKFDEKQIMWAEPSQTIYFPEATDGGGGTSVPHLDHIIGRMWLNWKESYSKVEGEVLSNVPTPWILCEVKSSLKHHSLNDFSSWFWNCGLTVGRLNFYLDYFSVATIIVLLRQIQCSLSSNDMRDIVVLNTLNQDPPVRDLSSRCRSFSSKIESDIIRILPQKNIQIEILITGPHIQLSLLNSKLYNKNVGDHLVSHVTFDICNIELAVSPKLEDYLGLSSENAAGCDRASEYHELEPQEIDAPEADNEAYSCEEQISLSAYLKVYGLKAYLVDSAESHKYQIIVLSPTTTRLQYTRKNHHSYDSKIVALSATFCCVATGFTMLLFLDEWHTLMKVFSGVFYESLAFAMYGSGDGPDYQELPSRESVYSDSERERTVLNIGYHESLVTNTQFFVHSTCELKSFDVILHNSRESYNLENYMNVMPIERETGRISATHDTSGLGIHISLQQLALEFNIKGGDMDFIIDITGVRSIIFRYLDQSERSFDKSELKNLLRALYFLAEAGITQSRVCLYLRSFTDLPSIRINSTDNVSCSHGKTTNMLGDLPLEVNGEGLVDHWLSANICISGIYMVGWEVKDILFSEQKLEEFSSVFSVGGAFQNISWRSKGGSVLLEAMAAAVFIECCTSYCHCILELWSASRALEQVVVSQQIKDMAAQDGHLGVKSQQVQLWDCLEVFSLFLSHLTFVLVARDEYGRLRELLFEFDFNLNLKLLNMVGKFSMGIPKFSVISLFMHGGMKDKAKVTQSSLSSSIISEDFFSSPNGKDGSSWLWNKETIQSGRADASGSSLSSSEKGVHVDSSTSGLRPKILHFSPQNSILKDLKCILAVEGPLTREQTSHALLNDIWVGNGSFSGFDMTITLTEIKMILSAYESISEASIRKRTSKVESAKQPNCREPEGSTEEIIPDGTIVAIQDTDQHMYIAVEGSETKYDIAGTIHYSLVGKRALFRVKYHNVRQWKSKARYFSLISLYANDDSGKPLRLSSNPRSRFVDISCSSDSEFTLWRMISFKEDTYEDAVELEFSSPLAKRTFHLLNKKNDCALAFTDGILEFVSKPGNLFKWKVFSDPGLGNLLLPNGSSWGSAETNLESGSNIIEMGESRTNRNHLGVAITVDKVSLTIVHELSNTEEKFPLLQGSVAPNQTIIQISKSKLRVINTSVIMLYFFDAQRNSWMDFVQPLEFHSFYRSKFHVRGSENMHGVPSHFYAKIKEVNFSVNELSLDILLFLIGELNIAGPYAVKKPVVLTNCGKVENQSGMTLLCHFYDNDNVSISARQSTTVLLRHLALENQPPEASFISLQLRKQEFLSTSPIHLSLLETRKFAWRTQIISSKDSKSFPGPLIVVEISKGIEDGISIVVAPMLKIHNETDFPLELRFQRPQHKETESASLMLKAGDVIDDSMTAFNAVDMSGGLRKALTSVSVGNFIFSFRPNIDDSLKKLNQSIVEWSDDLNGGKPVHLSGIFDKLSYKVRKAFSVDSMKCSLRSANCVLKSEEVVVANIHFLILTVGKGMPVINPDNFGYAPGNKDSPVATQEQKEIFVLPTVQVSNLLHTEIHVNLTDRDMQTSADDRNTWSNATIPCGSTVNFYANPETICFTVTLTSFDSRSKPVNSSDWVRKLQKQKNDIPHLDIELDIGGGKYFATLRLSRGKRGTLKVVILTSYALQNDTNALLFCFASNQKSLSSEDTKRFGPSIPPELGSYLPPNSIVSWFMKFPKLRLKLLEEKSLDTQLDLDALSGLAEIDLEVEDISGLKTSLRLGVSLRPSTGKEALSQIVTLSSRYVVCNESKENITVRQCYMEGMEELIAINSKQRIALRLKRVMKNIRETSIIENLLRKHTKSQDDTSLFIQFGLNESGLSWSGPVCVASLGRFFLKFGKSSEYPENQLNHLSNKDNLFHFAVVHVVEEGSSIVLHFHRPPDTDLPYRIENRLHDAPIAYYQKGSSEPESLGAGVSVSYVWDDLTLPRKLIIQLDDVHLLREINLDKVRSWKSFYRNKRTRGQGFHSPFEKKSEDHQQTTYSQLLRTETVKVGYEIYAEGVTRILRICDFSDSHKVNDPYGTRTKMQLRISYLAVHLLEHTKQEVGLSEPSDDAPIIIARFERINCDSMFTSRQKYNQIRIQSLSVDAKWIGAPFATILRRHQSEKSDANDCILRIMIVLLPSSSHVKQVKHLSIVLLPLNLNLDEETLMKIVPFWRSSLSDSSAPRQKYYFDHFEIHPIKIVASFLPGELYNSYSSTQDTLRSLLHSVIKIPAIQSKTVELNGVLVTHALITLRELTIKCAQHYSWYSMRAIYMAKGSPLLPPAFASIFDDSASSSLDVFFDPSSGLFNLPGMTLGTLKLISKFIDNKGFSGTKRYFGDLGKTLKTAGSNILFAAVTEVSDSVLKGAETSGFSGMVGGFHQGLLKLAMEPTVLGNAFMEGGPDRKIKLDRSPGIDELYIEGYLQAMLDTMYKQEYLRIKVIDNLVIVKNLPPSSALIKEIMESVNDFLASKALVKGETTTAHSLRYMRGEREWRIGPTMLTLCEHLFVSFAIRFLRKRAGKFVGSKLKGKTKEDEDKAIVQSPGGGDKQKVKLVWKWGIGKFVLSGLVAYIDGRLCRNIPNPLARRIVSGFLLSFLDTNDDESK